MSRQRLVGINHVALGVADVDAAVAFYTHVFDVSSVNRIPSGALLGLGDQFLALFERGAEEPHFGLVVPDKEAARHELQAAGAELSPGRFLDFRDPSGNRVQLVQYDPIQFTKAQRVLQGMGLALGKSEQALAELRAKGLA
jgi:catechol 2,3-dioxygenase-like lactoylglutathione lyase family enzyme